MRGDTRHSPPGWLNRLLLWFCDDALVEEIEGDLHEEYLAIYRQQGRARANRRYFISVLKFLKPRFMQKLSNTQDYVPRFGNYLKVSLRNFGKYKLVSAINLVGFAIGLAVIMIAGEYLYYQLSADRFIPNSERVYRITRGYRSQVYANLGFSDYYQSTRASQLANVRAFGQIPEVEAVTQFTISNSAIMGREFFVEGNGKRLPEEAVLYTNTPESFQEIFDWPILSGSLSGELGNGLIITRETALKYFGDAWPTMAVSAPMRVGEGEFLVKAVMEDIPENAHLSFSMAALVDSIPYTWGAYTYARFRPFDNLKAMEQKITEASYLVDPDAEEDANEKGLYLQPVRDIHLGSNHLYELESNIDPLYVYLFAVIGLIMLVITATNYINLTVAIYANRLKEIGVRKVIGARKKDIRSQFLFESVFITFMSLPIALLLVYLALPAFNNMMGLTLSQAVVFSPLHLGLVSLLALLIGFMCGIYPAGLLAARPLLSLFRGGQAQKLGGVNLRKALIGFQFLLLMVLSGFAFYVNQQLQFVQDKELGFEKEGILSFGLRGVEKFNLVKAELLKNPNVLEVGTGGLPGNNPFNTVNYRFEGIDEVFDDGNLVYMDLGSARALGLESPVFAALEQGKERVLVLNETAARKYEQVSGRSRLDLVGKNLIEAPQAEQEDGSFGYPEPIDGFIPDYHFFSLREDYNPLFVYVYRDIQWAFDMNVKINTAALYETVDFVEDIYYQFEKEQPFRATFLEDRLRALYGSENRVSELVAALSYLSVFLAFAGLVGLTYYMARLRQREVAIRKVLGARIGSLLGLMSREFLVMALLASVVAIPVSLLAINYWLDGFAFHVNPSVFSLSILAIAAIGLMLLGVLSQSYNTARSNPVNALKQE